MIRNKWLETLQQDVKVTTYKASGPGGQHRNKTESAVRLHHEPTGIIVTASENRSQRKNREFAWQRLIDKLNAREHKPKKRISTKVPRRAKERRLQQKRFVSGKKANRQKPDLSDESRASSFPAK